MAAFVYRALDKVCNYYYGITLYLHIHNIQICHNYSAAVNILEFNKPAEAVAIVDHLSSKRTNTVKTLFVILQELLRISVLPLYHY